MKFDAVLFDCDGVLVDSEGITNGVLRDMLEELGWVLTRRECMRIFLGKAVRDERALIEAKTGRPLTEDWLVRFRERRNAGLLAGVQPMPHALQAVAAVSEQVQGRIACCSGADRWKVEMQLAKCGLLPWFEGRIFSGHEMPRSKPAPDVYLAAGAAVYGYSPPEAGHDTPALLRAAGAVAVFADLAELPALLAASTSP